MNKIEARIKLFIAIRLYKWFHIPYEVTYSKQTNDKR